MIGAKRLLVVTLIVAGTSIPGTIWASSMNESDGFIAGELLESVDMGSGHKLEFYDFGDGQNAVRESYSMDSGDEAVLDAARDGMSLADIYRLAKPDALDSIPAEILEADARAAAIADTSGDLAVRNPAPDTQSGPPGSLPSTLQVQDDLAPLSCSGDYYGDGWGGDWFLHNYCTEGNFRWCNKNWGWANTGYQTTTWFRWKQMEGDFNERGWTEGWHKRSCWPWACAPDVLDWAYSVLPRHIEIWTYTGSGTRKALGTSACGHLHIAWLYNR